MKTVVSEKGQITIPKALRSRLGLLPGTILEFDADAGRLIGRKRASLDRFGKWRGTGRLPGGKRVDEYLAEIRG